MNSFFQGQKKQGFISKLSSTLQKNRWSIIYMNTNLQGVLCNSIEWKQKKKSELNFSLHLEIMWSIVYNKTTFFFFLALWILFYSMLTKLKIQKFQCTQKCNKLFEINAEKRFTDHRNNTLSHMLMIRNKHAFIGIWHCDGYCSRKPEDTNKVVLYTML